MNKKELQAMDLNQFRRMLTKISVETALNAKLEDNLGFGKGEQSEAGNDRNGYTCKTLQIEEGKFELDTPRDRYHIQGNVRR
jgi:putative transposase